MSDVLGSTGKMIIGAGVTAASIVGIPFTAGASLQGILVGASLFLEGVRGAIRGRPGRQQAQNATASTEATHKVVYGQTRIGSRASDRWAA